MQNHKKSARTFLHDAVDFVTLGAHSLENDDFSSCFRPCKDQDCGNLWYVLSFLIRYFILLPLRLTVMGLGIIIIGLLFLYGKYFRNYNIIQDSFLLFNKLMMVILNCRVRHVGEKRSRREPHVYVANHTSFIDYLVLSSYKFSHACISEGHSGLFGFILAHILSKNGSVGFKRSDRQDRTQVRARIKEHIHEKKASMLIFPEGTCVNNRYTVLFQKGAFDLDALVCPVGIRYRKDFLDPYWNRRFHGFTLHLLYLMTRWGMQAEVHWMEPVRRHPDEDAVLFSHRVKTLISREMKLKNTIWNGYLKSSPVLNDREIHRKGLQSVYLKLKRDELEKQRMEDVRKGRVYLLDENIDQTEKDDKMYFGKVSYRKFVNECCKEYLRIKGDAVISQIN